MGKMSGAGKGEKAKGDANGVANFELMAPF